MQQGFERRRFDIIVAANVLRDTRDIERALRNVRGLLRLDGSAGELARQCPRVQEDHAGRRRGLTATSGALHEDARRRAASAMATFRTPQSVGAPELNQARAACVLAANAGIEFGGDTSCLRRAVTSEKRK